MFQKSVFPVGSIFYKCTLTSFPFKFIFLGQIRYKIDEERRCKENGSGRIDGNAELLFVADIVIFLSFQSNNLIIRLIVRCFESGCDFDTT